MTTRKKLSIWKGATITEVFLAVGGNIEVESSNVVGSLVTKYEFEFDDDDGPCTITQGPLPLLEGQDVGLEPYIIPGTWLEY